MLIIAFNSTLRVPNIEGLDRVSRQLRLFREPHFYRGYDSQSGVQLKTSSQLITAFPLKTQYPYPRECAVHHTPRLLSPMLTLNCVCSCENTLAGTESRKQARVKPGRTSKRDQKRQEHRKRTLVDLERTR